MISIVLMNVMISIALFYLTQLHSFIGFYSEYLPIASGVNRKWQLSQCVPYNSVPPLKDIYRTTHIFLGIWSDWGGDQECGLF